METDYPLIRCRKIYAWPGCRLDCAKKKFLRDRGAGWLEERVVRVRIATKTARNSNKDSKRKTNNYYAVARKIARRGELGGRERL